MLEARRPMILPGQAERMEIAVADHPPIVELDSELERRLGGPHELGLVDAEKAVESEQRRDGALADADGADCVGLDQGDFRARTQRPRNRRGRHPSGGAAAGDDDPPQGPAAHWLSARSRKARSRPALARSSGASTPRPFSGICPTTSGPLVKT